MLFFLVARLLNSCICLIFAQIHSIDLSFNTSLMAEGEKATLSGASSGAPTLDGAHSEDAMVEATSDANAHVVASLGEMAKDGSAPKEADFEGAGSLGERGDFPNVVMDIAESEVKVMKLRKPDSFGFISSLQVHPSHPRVLVPLCRLVALPLVRPIRQQNVKKLEAEFVNGYRSGDRALYLSILNDKGLDMEVTPEISSSWSSHWLEASASFDLLVQDDPELSSLHGKMLFVWDGNHQFTAWWRYVERNASGDHYDAKYYRPVECICIDPRGNVGPLLDAMNDVNR